MQQRPLGHNSGKCCKITMRQSLTRLSASSFQEGQKWYGEAQHAAQLRAALEEAQIQSKKDIIKAQALKEEADQLHQDLEVGL